MIKQRKILRKVRNWKRRVTIDMNKDKQIQKVSKLSLEKLSEDSKLAKRGLRDLSIWPKIEELFSKLKSAFENRQINECIKIAEEILQTDSNHFLRFAITADVYIKKANMKNRQSI